MYREEHGIPFRYQLVGISYLLPLFLRITLDIRGVNLHLCQYYSYITQLKLGSK